MLIFFFFKSKQKISTVDSHFGGLRSSPQYFVGAFSYVQEN